MSNYNKISERVTQAIQEEVFPGCVIGIIKNGIREIYPFGYFRYDGLEKVLEDSIYDVASITKSIPTSSLALVEIDRGNLELDGLVKKYIPELKSEKSGQVQIWHLLTHTLELDFRMSLLKDLPGSEILNKLFDAKILSAGEKYCYSNASSVLLGIIIERVTNKPLDELSREYFFDPLDMKDTSFDPKDKTRVVPTEVDGWRGREVAGEVHDESAYKLREIMTAGSAGLFSTANDLLNFLEMLLAEGVHKDERFFSKQMISLIFGNHDYKLDAKLGIGWELAAKRFMGNCSARAIGKTGFTGTSVMCDPEKRIGVVILSNFTYPKRRKNIELISLFRSDIANVVYGD